MRRSEYMEWLALEKYGIRDSKATYIQALNMKPFYYLSLLKLTPATIVFADLIWNYDLVLLSIAL